MEEERNFGKVKLNVYSAYCEAVGLYVTPVILASLFLMQSSKNVSDWWLAHWVSSMQNTTNSSETNQFLYESEIVDTSR